MDASAYRAIFDQLSSQLEELRQSRVELEVKLGDIENEIGSLEETLKRLGPLAGYLNDPDDIGGLGITEAVRGVLDLKNRMSAAEVKIKMEQKGFDFSRYSAPDASVRTILRRLVDAEKAEVVKEGFRTYYKYLPTDDEIPF
jgi:hypothetical protein